MGRCSPGARVSGGSLKPSRPGCFSCPGSFFVKKSTAQGSEGVQELKPLDCTGRGKVFCPLLRVLFKNVTRHSNTHTESHLNQQHANCVFIWLDTGQALFREIRPHIVGTILWKENLLFFLLI